MFRLLEKWSQNERQVFLKNIRIHGTVIKNKRYVNRSKTQLTAGFPLESKEKCEKVFFHWGNFKILPERRGKLYRKIKMFYMTSITRQHSSRIHTTRLPMICVLVATTRWQYQWGMSSSEQVWTGLQWWPPDFSSRGRGSSQGLMSRKRGVPNHVTYSMCMWCLPPPLPKQRLTRSLWKHYHRHNFVVGSKNVVLYPWMANYFGKNITWE